MEKKLEQMVSAHVYDEIKNQVIEQCGEDVAKYIFPAVCKALEDGDGRLRSHILHHWLEVDSVRVCSQCGALMSEGWYLDFAGYACSDECAAKSEGITMEQFEKWRIYKDDIIQWLEDNDDPRTIDELTKEECDTIIEEEIALQRDYCWTEWS